MIAGYATLAPGASLSITLYLGIKSSLSIDPITGTTYSPDATIAVFSQQNNQIVSGNTNALALALSNLKGSTRVALSGTMNRPYAVGNSYPLYLTF